MQCKNTFRISMIFSLVSMTIVSTSSSIFFVAGITSEIIALSVSIEMNKIAHLQCCYYNLQSLPNQKQGIR